MKTWFSIGILTGILALACSSAFAYRIDGFEIKAIGDAKGGYDSNITSAKDDTKSDFFASLGAGLSCEYEGKKNRLQLTGNVIQQLYAHYNRFNNTSEYATIKYDHELSKYDRIRLSDAFSHTYEAENFSDEFGRASGWYSYIRNRFSIAYERDIAKQVALILRYGNNIDAPFREDLNDSYLNSVGMEIDYAYSSATVVYMSYDAWNRDFRPGKDATTQEIAGGIRQYFTKQLYCDGKAGVDIIKSYTGKLYQKPLFELSVTDDIDKRTTARLGFFKEYRSTAYMQDIFNYWEIFGSVARQFTERLKGSAGCFYGKGEYVAGTIEDDLFGLNAGLTYEFRKNIRGVVSYNFSNTFSNQRYREYTRNLIMAGIKIDL